jgi:hypothetical protein
VILSAMKTLDKPFRALTQAAFARYGFAYGDLLNQWEAIAGASVARLCRPERIAWPRQAGELRQRQGGTLYLRALAGRALELHYETPRLIERINAFYGYAAITAIKLRQAATLAPAPQPTQLRNLDAESEAALETELAGIRDDSLRQALRRLGQGALSALESSQQDQ